MVALPLWNKQMGGYSHLLASTLFLRAVVPATVLSHKYDILSFRKTTKLSATISCQYFVGTSRRGNIVLWSRSPRKCRYPLFAYPLFAYPLFKRAQFKISVRDRSFQTRLKISTEPLTKPQFFWGSSQVQDWNFQARLKFFNRWALRERGQ